MKSSLAKYLKAIPTQYRSRIKKLAKEKGFVVTIIKLPQPDKFTGLLERKNYAMNPFNREILAEAIFAIENEAESKGDGHPFDNVIVKMRQARNELYDDLGFNEYHKKPTLNEEVDETEETDEEVDPETLTDELLAV